MLPVVVLDSNVFVSALLGRGSCREIVATWRAGLFVVATSSSLLEELRRVLNRPKLTTRVSQADIVDLLAFIEDTAVRVTPPALRHPICRDKSDDRVFACALAAGAACIVSGDADVLTVAPISDLELLTPRQFLAWLSAR